MHDTVTCLSKPVQNNMLCTESLTHVHIHTQIHAKFSIRNHKLLKTKGRYAAESTYMAADIFIQ